MNRSRLLQLLAALLALVAAAPSALADQKAMVRDEVARRGAATAGATRGAAFRAEGRSYQLLGGVRAVAALPSERPAETLARAGASSADLVETKGRFLLVRSGGPAAAGAVLRAGAAPTHPVAIDAATGRLAVLPGTIVVRPRRLADAEALAAAHGATVQSKAPFIGTAFMTVPAGADLVAVAAALAADPAVRSAEVEAREAFPEAQ